LRSKKVKNDKNVKILPVWAIRIHVVTTKIHLGETLEDIFTNISQKVWGDPVNGHPGGQKPKF
jgi:hypothetical protein